MVSPFWVNDVYSLGYWLKDYGFYPKRFPLFTYMDHGNTLFDTIAQHEIENDSPLIFKFPPRLVIEYKKVSEKPVHCLLNPSIHYRLKNKIKPSIEAKGTLFFLAHSTPAIDDLTNWDEFIVNLINIPKQYEPIDFCLHHHDVVKGLDRIFISKGFKVVTAGNPHENTYARIFYNILRNYKYTLSNLIGSYTFYSIEMGIPFSLFGNEPIYNNKEDNNIELGSYTSYRNQTTYQKAVSLFKGFHTNISNQQLDFVSTELGKLDTISRLRTSLLLYKALVQYFIRHPTIIKSSMGYRFVQKFKRRIWNEGIYRILNPSIKYFSLKQDKLYSLVKKNYLTLTEIYNLRYSGEKMTSSVFMNNPIKITDTFWYLHGLNEIFIEEVYRFQSDTKTPLIIDCGSNIGLSIIYFKSIYPEAKIIGFEPDNIIFKMLESNINQFNLKDVELHQKAVWINDEPLFFKQTGSVGGHIASEESSNTIKVGTTRLKDLLNKGVDFLKLDIEGAEYKILTDCEVNLKNIKNIFIEYHSFHENEQMIGELLQIIKRAGFKIYIKEAWNNMGNPFIEKRGPYFDLQLNIFGYRR